MADISSPPTPATASTFRWARDDGSTNQSLSPTFILSEEKRPQLSKVEPSSIPVIDLKEAEDIIREKLVQACEEYGIFYVVNHGIDKELCNEMLSSIVDFFQLPPEQGRAQLHTTDFKKDIKIFNYHEPDGDKRVPGWSEVLTHLWHPSDDSFVDAIPINSPQYRESIRRYAKEIGVMFNKLFGWLSEGLGLERDALEKNMGEKLKYYKMQANFYPPCPNPELTLGLPVHNDMTALTVIRQTEGVTGLHIIKDGKWMAVNPIPNAFVCNVGDALEVLSNGRYKSVRHRAVTSKDKIRVSLASFVAPNKQTMVGPIKELVDEQHPPLYETFLYANFHEKILRPWLHPNK